ncbi:hypothetical protein T07_11148 [Trichinella nelsoni]|uniref:Uncharacterized protein n=1 Tax=Trichinella nelsoni TaxID=6336 RepID=A0A0V0S8M4_9BILA|nr:hypothetical protein T07_11148 [Trichinella nelsoni]
MICKKKERKREEWRGRNRKDEEEFPSLGIQKGNRCKLINLSKQQSYAYLTTSSFAKMSPEKLSNIEGGAWQKTQTQIR